MSHKGSGDVIKEAFIIAVLVCLFTFGCLGPVIIYVEGGGGNILKD